MSDVVHRHCPLPMAPILGPELKLNFRHFKHKSIYFLLDSVSLLFSSIQLSLRTQLVFFFFPTCQALLYLYTSLIMKRSCETQAIFSEFADPRRADLIRRIVELTPSVENIPRPNLLFLWFADIQALEHWATPDKRSGVEEQARKLRYLLFSNVPKIDLPTLCKYTA